MMRLLLLWNGRLLLGWRLLLALPAALAREQLRAQLQVVELFGRLRLRWLLIGRLPTWISALVSAPSVVSRVMR